MVIIITIIDAKEVEQVVSKRFRKDRRGAIGIETLIVFIAMVLVAAVSAAVLIQTVGYLQQKAMATGRETTKEVASGLKVTQVLGYDPNTPGGNITKLAVLVEPNTGGQPIDLSKVTVTISNGQQAAVLQYSNTAAFSDLTTGGDLFSTSLDAWNSTNLGSNNFGIIVLQDPDGSITSTTPTMNSGDKVALTINVSAVFGNGLPVSTHVTGQVRPEFGAPGIIDFITPPTYTVNIVDLQ